MTLLAAHKLSLLTMLLMTLHASVRGLMKTVFVTVGWDETSKTQLSSQKTNG